MTEMFNLENKQQFSVNFLFLFFFNTGSCLLSGLLFVSVHSADLTIFFPCNLKINAQIILDNEYKRST